MMKKDIKWFLIFDITLFVLQLVNSILYCVVGNPICAAMTGFASGTAFMGAIVLYDQYKDCEE